MFELMPFRNGERSVWSYLDNLEQSFLQNSPSFSHFKTDIVDAGDKYVLSAELPGFEKEDIGISADSGTLKIQARRQEETEEKKDNYIRRERKMGAYSRSFDLTGVQADQISARYENGILTLELPKAQPDPVPPARRIEIQ